MQFPDLEQIFFPRTISLTVATLLMSLAGAACMHHDDRGLSPLRIRQPFKAKVNIPQLQHVTHLFYDEPGQVGVGVLEAGQLLHDAVVGVDLQGGVQEA